MAITAIAGARREFVAVPIEGTLEREIVKWIPGKNGKGGQMKRELVKKPAGYMVYFPRGHAIRMTEEQLKFYHLNRKPRLINMTGLHDPNSPVGKLMAEQEEERRQGNEEIDKMTVRLATAKSGTTLLPEQTDAGLTVQED